MSKPRAVRWGQGTLRVTVGPEAGWGRRLCWHLRGPGPLGHESPWPVTLEGLWGHLGTDLQSVGSPLCPQSACGSRRVCLLGLLPPTRPGFWSLLYPAPRRGPRSHPHTPGPACASRGSALRFWLLARHPQLPSFPLTPRLTCSLSRQLSLGASDANIRPSLPPARGWLLLALVRFLSRFCRLEKNIFKTFIL